MGRTGRRFTVVAFAVATLLATMLGTAGADYSAQYHGSDKAWVTDTHDHLNVEDRECDGNGVYAEGYHVGGGSNYVKVWDTNGCSKGWGHGDGIDFYKYRLCENRVGCNGWRST